MTTTRRHFWRAMLGSVHQSMVQGAVDGTFNGSPYRLTPAPHSENWVITVGREPQQLAFLTEVNHLWLQTWPTSWKNLTQLTGGTMPVGVIGPCATMPRPHKMREVWFPVTDGAPAHSPALLVFETMDTLQGLVDPHTHLHQQPNGSDLYVGEVAAGLSIAESPVNHRIRHFLGI